MIGTYMKPGDFTKDRARSNSSYINLDKIYTYI